jgi:phosphoribosylaminoimidazolecarboxamide formyltransferase/IMP cyclohydrolase
VIIAPSIAEGVLEVTGAKKNVRVLVCGELPALDDVRHNLTINASMAVYWFKTKT